MKLLLSHDKKKLLLRSFVLNKEARLLVVMRETKNPANRRKFAGLNLIFFSCEKTLGSNILRVLWSVTGRAGFMAFKPCGTRFLGAQTKGRGTGIWARPPEACFPLVFQLAFSELPASFFAAYVGVSLGAPTPAAAANTSVFSLGTAKITPGMGRNRSHQN